MKEVTFPSPHLPKRAICIIGLCGWLACWWALACAPLQGTECRSQTDCDTPRICRKGWCLAPDKLQPLLACPSHASAALTPPILQSKDHEELGQAASDDHYLYWTDRKREHLARQPVTGGDHEILHEKLGPVEGLLLDGESIFLHSHVQDTKRSTILKTSIYGGRLETLATNLAKPRQMMQDQDNLYWNVVGPFERTKEAHGFIMQMSKQGGTPKILAREYRPYAIAIDDTYLYWITSHETGALRRLKHGPQERIETLLPQLSYARDIAVDDAYVYILADGLFRMAKEGGQPERLTPDLSGTALVIDKHFAYIATGNGLRQISLHCTTPNNAFATLRTPGAIRALAIDSSYLFLLHSNNGNETTEILRASKRPQQDWKPTP